MDITSCVPSKCLISKLYPVKASNKEIFLSMNKSAPFLVKIGCFFIIILTYKSPAIMSGASSPSPVSIQSCSWGTPGSNEYYIYLLPNEISISLVLSTILFPLQVLHLFLGSHNSPSPLQSGQCYYEWVYIPGPNITIFSIIFRPLQVPVNI